MSALARYPDLASRPAQRAWLAVAIVVVCIALPLLVFQRTTAAMVTIWARSETFSHCFAVIPIVLWLVWQRRRVLAELPVVPFLPAIALLALAGAGWLLMDLAEANAPSQFALIAMVPLLVWSVLGTAWLRVLAFPLAFLFFAVPFGEAIVPWLMDRTADFTVAALKASGIPVYREGNRFLIPTGAWSVVEACSGIRYLIASLMLGVLYAQLMYRSAGRRIAFIAAAAIVPIVANWLRAYLIVLTGHLTRNEVAVGIDHLIYGWIFFGLVIGVMFAVGARWREHVPPPTAPALAERRTGGSVMLAVIAACLALVPWSLAAEQLRSRSPAAQHTASLPPIEVRSGWTTVAATSDWQPQIVAPTFTETRAFADARDTVFLTVAYFARQTKGSETVNAANQLVPSEGRWVALDRARASTVIDGDTVQPVSVLFRSGAQTRLAWRWYWLAGSVADRDVVAKLRLAWARLRGGSDAGAWIVIHTAVDGDRARADAALERFAQDMGPAVHRALQAAGGVQ